MGKKEEYEQKALLYAEKYGVIEYRVIENEMVFEENINGGNGVTSVYRETINLDKMKGSRKQIK